MSDENINNNNNIKEVEESSFSFPLTVNECKNSSNHLLSKLSYGAEYN